MIDKQFVINLKIRPDRLQSFFSFLPEKLGEVEVYPAVHGDSCRHPSWWNAGSGAWGCYRSHISLLEHCMSNDIQSYMVFEDDSVFTPGFDDKFKLFIDNLPPDWDMFYLGGSLLHTNDHPPAKVNEHVYIPYNVNRTHCFAVNKKGYNYLYEFLLRRFEDRTWHIDHHLGRLHEQKNFNVYCPATWLVGQGESSSNIDGKYHTERYFDDPITLYRANTIATTNVCVVLDTDIETVKKLVSKHNWHHGYDLEENMVDKGLRNLNTFPESKVRQWWYYIKRECVDHKKVPFIWKPGFDFTKIDLPFEPIYIRECSDEKVLQKYKSETLYLNG
jgi:GR25 family glycosyltransferase involved in LPS biosynthesis